LGKKPVRANRGTGKGTEPVKKTRKVLNSKIPFSFTSLTEKARRRGPHYHQEGLGGGEKSLNWGQGDWGALVVARRFRKGLQGRTK